MGPRGERERQYRAIGIGERRTLFKWKYIGETERGSQYNDREKKEGEKEGDKERDRGSQ